MSTYRAFTINDGNLRLEYFPNPSRWHENITDLNNPILNEDQWSKEIKYLNNTNDDISDDIKNIPNNTGGVYMFFIKGISLPFIEKYIMYVGRAEYTEHQNIRKRAKEYLKPDRDLIKYMFQWKEYLYYRYYPDTDNKRIIDNEAMLIRAIVPPCNETIPNKIEVKRTINAF